MPRLKFVSLQYFFPVNLIYFVLFLVFFRLRKILIFYIFSTIGFVYVYILKFLEVSLEIGILFLTLALLLCYVKMLTLVVCHIYKKYL